MKKRVFFVILIVFSVIYTRADQTVTVNGIIYSLTDTYAIIVGVTGQPTKLDIPAVVQNKPVTQIRIPLGTSNHTHIANIVIPENISYIGPFSFDNCEVEKISFNRCKNLHIDVDAFCQCANLSKIEFVACDNVQIGTGAFEYCNNLKEIILPSGKLKIDRIAFANCGNLKKITIPCGIGRDSIEVGAFGDCERLKTVIIEDGNTPLMLYDRNHNSTLIFQGSPIEELYLGRNIIMELEKSNSPFGSYYNGGWSPTVSRITIGDSVTYISAGLFSDLPSIREFNMGKNIRSIQSEGLSIYPLSEIDLPESLDSICEKAFEGSALQQISIPNNTKVIGREAFTKSNELKKAIIGNAVYEIGEYAFEDCSKLEEVFIGEKVRIIGDFAFRNCVGLKEITIPPSVEIIGKGLFNGCSNLSNVSLGKKIKKIDGCFNGCEKLEKLIIPNNIDTITGIVGTVFKEFVIEDGVTSILLDGSLGRNIETIYIGRDFIFKNERVSVFTGQTNLSYLKFGQEVTTIPSYAFCLSGLKELSITEPIHTIGVSAFSACSNLERIILPKTLQSIEGDAFVSCYNIKEITSWNSDPPTIRSTTFTEDTEDNATLLVPIGSAAAYSTAPYWKNFNSIIEIDALGLPEKNVLKRETDKIWSLEGKRQNDNSLIKGIYIINGKKVIK